MKSPEGCRYWQINFNIEMLFGRTSLEANIVWDEGVRPTLTWVDVRMLIFARRARNARSAFSKEQSAGSLTPNVQGPVTPIYNSLV